MFNIASILWIYALAFWMMLLMFSFKQLLCLCEQTAPQSLWILFRKFWGDHILWIFFWNQWSSSAARGTGFSLFRFSKSFMTLLGKGTLKILSLLSEPWRKNKKGTLLQFSCNALLWQVSETTVINSTAMRWLPHTLCL